MHQVTKFSSSLNTAWNCRSHLTY